MHRVTHSEVGTIFHRPETILLRPKRCYRGHVVPRYEAGHCVVCSRLVFLDFKSRRPGAKQKRPYHHIARFADYGYARSAHEERGGWLLILEPGIYGVTANETAVARLRGRKWVERCEVVQCWDEVELAGTAGSAGNG